MRKIVSLVALVLTASTGAIAMAQGQPAATTAPATDPATAARDAQARALQAAGDVLLAQRTAGLAHDLLRQGTPSPATWRQSAALLAASQKLDPREPIYPQLLAEALIRAGDLDGGIGALKAYRLLVPSDHVAQVKLIDLYASRFQVAEKRLSYLTSILDNPTIPPEVRSYVANNAGLLYLERSQATQAKAMFDQALRLNPLNPDALQATYDSTRDSATLAERVGTLLQMMRSNPTNATAAAELATSLSTAGLVRPSLDWYAFAIRVWNAQRQSPPHRFVIDYAAQFLLADRPEDAGSLADQLLRLNASDVDALLIHLLANRRQSAEALKIMTDDAGAVLRGRVVAATQQGSEAAKPPTPLPGELPDLSAELTKANEAGNEPSREALFAALSDLTWFQIYFQKDASRAERSLALLSKVTEEGNVTLARLQGWLLLLQNRPQEAAVKLSAVADRDPISAMGLAQVKLKDPATKAEGLTTARDALAKAPAGLMGALVWDGLNDLGVKRMSDNGAELIAAQLDKFPRQWLSIIDEPETFYTVRGEPSRGTYAFGEPMWAKVTLVNNGNFDITVGSNGVLKPDLWFDAQLRGMVQQSLSGVTYDRFSQVLVLRAKQSITQYVRIDRGPLAKLLASNPSPAVQVFASAVTNPSATETGITPGAAGARVQFPRIFARSPFPIQNEQARAGLTTKLNSGTPSEKFQTIELLRGLSDALNAAVANTDTPEQQPESVEPSRRLAQQLTALLNQARGDGLSAVSAWSWHLATVPLQGDERARNVRAMADNDAWSTRLLAVVNAMSMPPEARGEILTSLSTEDAEPIVRQFAAATLETATTQPAASAQ